MVDQVDTNELELDSIKKNLTEIWHYKVFYVLVILFAIGIWFLYIKFASETYSVGSTILIRTKLENSRPDSYELMNIFSIMGQDIIMQNEISRINSTPLIKEVLYDLGQNVSYYTQKNKLPKHLSFSLVNIYNQAPFLVVMNMDHIQPLNTLFYINIINDEEFTIGCKGETIWLYNYRTEDHLYELNDINFSGRFKFGENIQSEHFSFKLLLNSNYNHS